MNCLGWYVREIMNIVGHIELNGGISGINELKSQISYFSLETLEKCLDLWGIICWVRREKEIDTFIIQNLKKY